jgi:hypothetical protein
MKVIVWGKYYLEVSLKRGTLKANFLRGVSALISANFGSNSFKHLSPTGNKQPITIAKSISVIGCLLFPSGITQTASEMSLVMK